LGRGRRSTIFPNKNVPIGFKGERLNLDRGPSSRETAILQEEGPIWITAVRSDAARDAGEKNAPEGRGVSMLVYMVLGMPDGLSK